MTICSADIQVDEEAGVSVCRPQGDLDAKTSVGFREVAAGLCGRPLVVFDLSGLTFIDSCGLGVLIGAIRRIRECDGKVAVCAGRGPISRLLRTVGLDRLVTVEDNLELAMGCLGQPESVDLLVPRPT